MYTHFTLFRGSVTCSRTLRQRIELATFWLLNDFSTSCTTVPIGSSQALLRKHAGSRCRVITVRRKKWDIPTHMCWNPRHAFLCLLLKVLIHAEWRRGCFPSKHSIRKGIQQGTINHLNRGKGVSVEVRLMDLNSFSALEPSQSPCL